MNETLYLALAETNDVLRCFIDGWKVAVRNMTLADWCCFGNQVVLELGWQEWSLSNASTTPADLPRLL